MDPLFERIYALTSLRVNEIHYFHNDGIILAEPVFFQLTLLQKIERATKSGIPEHC